MLNLPGTGFGHCLLSLREGLDDVFKDGRILKGTDFPADNSKGGAVCFSASYGICEGFIIGEKLVGNFGILRAEFTHAVFLQQQDISDDVSIERDIGHRWPRIAEVRAKNWP